MTTDKLSNEVVDESVHDPEVDRAFLKAKEAIAAEFPDLDIEKLWQKTPAYLAEGLSLLRDGVHTGISPRAFYLADGKTLLALLLVETVDSYLIGAPARMIIEDSGELFCRPGAPMGVIRLHKSSCSLNSLIPHEYIVDYFEYVEENGHRLLPGFLTDDRIAQMSGFKAAMKSVETNVKRNSEEMGDHLLPDNAGEDAFYIGNEDHSIHLKH